MLGPSLAHRHWPTEGTEQLVGLTDTPREANVRKTLIASANCWAFN